MTNPKIDEKIAKLEKAISSPATPEKQKESFKEIIKKLEAARTKDKYDTMPAAGTYGENLRKIIEKTGISESEARKKYGQYTISQWDKLLKEEPTKSKATIYEALLELADTDATAAKRAWDAYSKEEKEAFKTWVNEGDAASEGIFKGFLYQLKHAPKSADKKTGVVPFTPGQGSKITEAEKEAELKRREEKAKKKADKKSPENKSGFTKEQYKKFLQEYDNVGAQYEDAEGDKQKQAEIKLKMDTLENKIHAYERDYQYNETVSKGDYVKWKGRDGAFQVIGIHEGQATLKKVGDYKMSYSAPTKDLTIVQESTEKRAAKTEPVKPAEPAAPKKDPYDCEDLIATEKARIRKLKELAKERAAAPKHTPATKNKLAIEKVGDRVVTNLNKRIEKGDVKRPELERLIKTTEDVLSSLKAALKKL